MEASRRDFLKGVLAAALVTALPAATVAEIDRRSEWLLDQFKVSMNGELPDTISIHDMGGGWHRLYAYFTQDVNDGFHVDFSSMEGGGLRIAGDKRMWIESNSDEMQVAHTMLESDQGKTVFSMFVKLAG